MITFSGQHIQRIDQTEHGTPTPIDIAVHAGRICRFGGAVWAPLLAHLMFVGLLAYKRSGKIENFIWGLLHDAHEVVTSDVPRPFMGVGSEVYGAVINNRRGIGIELKTAYYKQAVKNVEFAANHINAEEASLFDALPNESMELAA